MKRFLPLWLPLLVLICPRLLVAGTENFAGEYANKSYLNSTAVFQMSLEQSGSDVSVFFTAVHNDGTGAAPDGDGRGKVTGKGVVEFKWGDAFQNAGTGTIKKSGNDIIVSMKPTRVNDSRAIVFYGDNIHLTSVGKKK